MFIQNLTSKWADVGAIEEYQGLYLGKLNTYFHQVTGDVYVVDDHTFLIKNFHYDGLGKGNSKCFCYVFC